MLAVCLRQPTHLTPTKAHQRRGFRYFDPACSQILQHAHPVDLRPAHRNHRHRPKTPQPKLWRVTSLSGPTVTSLSGVYKSSSHNDDYGMENAPPSLPFTARPPRISAIGARAENIVSRIVPPRADRKAVADHQGGINPLPCLGVFSRRR